MPITPPTLAEYLKYGNLQMAAEALFGFDATVNGTALIPGDIAPDGRFTAENLTIGNRHNSKFTEGEAEKLVEEWIVVEHISHTETGFSGTLFKHKDTGECVLSMRSTEFIDDAARDNQATNILEIKEKGWAFGQINDMEKWYQSLTDRGLVDKMKLTVTGYSLGGHLATAFNLMHPDDANRVILFNGAGTGTIRDGGQLTTWNELPKMIAHFDALLEQAKTTAGLESLMQSGLGKETYHALIQKWTGDLYKCPATTLIELLNSRMYDAVYHSDTANPDQWHDYFLLKDALERVKSVTDYARWAPTLPSGGTPANPANIPDVTKKNQFDLASTEMNVPCAFSLIEETC